MVNKNYLPCIIAHRGARDEAPENTLAAFRTALALPGLSGIEFDVELTADGKAVVLHQETVVPDPDFKRVVVAVRDFTARDWVGERTCRDIVTLDAGSWFSSEFIQEKVPMLEEVLSLRWGDVVPFVELKDATFWGKKDPERPKMIVDAALPALASFAGKLRVMSFNPAILCQVKAHLSGVVCALELWTEWRGRVSEAVREALACGASYLSIPESMALESVEWVSAANEHGIGLLTYPVSPVPGEAEHERWTAQLRKPVWLALRELGVDGIISDFPRQTLRSEGVLTG